MSKASTAHVSAELLNQLVLAGLPWSEAAIVRDHLMECSECRGRAEILELCFDETGLSSCEGHTGEALDLEALKKKLKVFQCRLELLKRLHTENGERWAEAMFKLHTLTKRLMALQCSSTKERPRRDE